jgi:hypothetical protein
MKNDEQDENDVNQRHDIDLGKRAGTAKAPAAKTIR